MQTPQKQQGMTAIGWMLVIALVMVLGIVLLKLMPVYLDGYKVYQSLASLEEDSSAHGKGPAELRTMLMKRLDINMVNDVTKDDISITRTKSGYEIEVDYEARRQLFGNLYAVVVFNKAVEVPGR